MASRMCAASEGVAKSMSDKEGRNKKSGLKFLRGVTPFSSDGVKQRAATIAAIGLSTLVIPLSYALAQTGLVQCDGINCQLCSLASLAQNIIKFTILLAVPLAAILFAYAGALYITARGNPGQIEKAHGIFGKVALGFILALAGWLIVNTILVTIANRASFSSGVDFFTIQCVTNRPTNKTLDELLAGRPTIAAGAGLCPSARPNFQNGNCCTTAGTDCQAPPRVDPSCTPDFPTYDGDKKQCCNGTACTAPRPDTQCTTDFPRYNAGSNQCCKFDDATQCQAAATGGGFTYDPSVQAQAGDASGELSGLLSCMGGRAPGGFVVTSISDNMLAKYGGSQTWAQCRAGQCQHSANSCHYGGRSGPEVSYAADIRTRDLSPAQMDALQQAAVQCNGQVNLEGDHLHVSVPACGGL